MTEYDDYDFMSESARETAYAEISKEISHLEDLLSDNGIISRANVVLQAHMCHRDAKLYGGEKCICSDTETAEKILRECQISDAEYQEQIAEWNQELETLFEKENELAGTFKSYFD